MSDKSPIEPIRHPRALAGGSRLTRGTLAADLGMSVHAVATALSKLKRKGRVRQFARGVWEKAS